MGSHRGKFERLYCEQGLNKLKQLPNIVTRVGKLTLIRLNKKEDKENYYFHIKGIPDLTINGNIINCHLLSIEGRDLRVIQVNANGVSSEISLVDNIYDIGGYLNQSIQL